MSESRLSVMARGDSDIFSSVSSEVDVGKDFGGFQDVENWKGEEGMRTSEACGSFWEKLCKVSIEMRSHCKSSWKMSQ